MPKGFMDGYPTNDSFEVEDSKTKLKKRRMLDELEGISKEDLLSQMPEDLIENLRQNASNFGIDFDQMIDAALQSSKDMFNSMSKSQLDQFEKTGAIPISFNFNDILNTLMQMEEEADKEKEHSYHELNKLKYLLAEGSGFGEIECLSDPNLYKNFMERFGEGPSYSPAALAKIEDLSVISIDKNPPVKNITSFEYVSNTNEFILFYGRPSDKDSYGMFFAITQDLNGSYNLVVPSYGNTYKFSEDEESTFYNLNDDSEMFAGDGSFLPLNYDKIITGLKLLLAPKRKIIINPKMFGNIIQQKVSMSGNSSLLRVGIIRSNNSPEANLLKKDGDLDQDVNDFEFYFHLNNITDASTLRALAKWLKTLDLDNNNLLKYSELKVEDSFLYVDVDFGDLLEYYKEWKAEENINYLEDDEDE